MGYKTRQSGDVKIIDFEEDIRDDSLPEFKEVLNEVADSEQKVLCNLELVFYMNSLGLGVVSAISRKLKSKGGALKLVNLSSKIRELFKITHLDTLIEIYDNEDAAIKSFQT